MTPLLIAALGVVLGLAIGLRRYSFGYRADAAIADGLLVTCAIGTAALAVAALGTIV